MASAPKQVNTRKIALIRELGYDEREVSENGFDREGFNVVKFGPDGKVLADRDGVLVERVLWPDIEWSRRAGEAMGGDFNETHAERPEDRSGRDENIQGSTYGGAHISERHTGAESASIGELNDGGNQNG